METRSGESPAPVKYPGVLNLTPQPTAASGKRR